MKDQISDKKEELIAGGLGVASPFAGEIGRERTKDPLKELKKRGQKPVAGTKKLKEMVQPGDVLLESVPARTKKLKFLKNRLSVEVDERDFSNANKAIFSGSRWHHAEVVQDNKRTTFTGIKHQYGDKSRPLESFQGSDLVLLRRKNNKPLTKKQKENVVGATRKLRDDTWGGKPSKRLVELSKKIDKNKKIPKPIRDKASQAASYMSEAPDALKIVAKDWFKPKLKKSNIGSYARDCEGGVCSSSGEAVAHAAKTNKTGKGAVRGKKPNTMLPADYLRSKDWEVVTVRTKGGKMSYADPRNFGARQKAVRGVVGLAIGSAAMGLVSAGKYFKNKGDNKNG